MKRRFEIVIDKGFDHELLERVEDIFHGENLLQVILHAHLLIERAISLEIVKKLARPEIMEDGRYGHWSFRQKLALYVGLYNPPEDRERMLIGFNKLRNTIAHRFENEEECVANYLPWEGKAPRPDAHTHVVAVAIILFFELGIVKSVRRLDP